MNVEVIGYGHVQANLNGKEIGRVSYKMDTTIEFDFKNGDTLELCEVPGPSSVNIRFNNLVLSL